MSKSPQRAKRFGCPSWPCGSPRHRRRGRHPPNRRTPRRPRPDTAHGHGSWAYRTDPSSSLVAQGIPGDRCFHPPWSEPQGERAGCWAPSIARASRSGATASGVARSPPGSRWNPSPIRCTPTNPPNSPCCGSQAPVGPQLPTRIARLEDLLGRGLRPAEQHELAAAWPRRAPLPADPPGSEADGSRSIRVGQGMAVAVCGARPGWQGD